MTGLSETKTQSLIDADLLNECIDGKRARLKKMAPGANPTTVSYNASAVNFYNATDNLARFEN
jgi:hypothetical protein